LCTRPDIDCTKAINAEEIHVACDECGIRSKRGGRERGRSLRRGSAGTRTTWPGFRRKRSLDRPDEDVSRMVRLISRFTGEDHAITCPIVHGSRRSCRGDRSTPGWVVENALISCGRPRLSNGGFEFTRRLRAGTGNLAKHAQDCLRSSRSLAGRTLTFHRQGRRESEWSSWSCTYCLRSGDWPNERY